MAIDRYQVSLKAILKDVRGKILCLNARPDGLFKGYFDLPGGRIEDAEFEIPFMTVLEREVKEEIGDVEIALVGDPVALGRHRSADGTHVLYIFFEGMIKGDAIQLSDEHTGFSWIDLTSARLDEIFCSGILEGMKQYCAQQ
jgi:8-oxo-dGTP pyrophosphatase MutT (NUDIX family)